MREIVAEITKAIPDEDRVIALDRVLAIVDKSTIVPKNVDGIKADPPTIFFSKTPAVLVNFDGEPIWSPIKENDLKFAVNTNWDLFQHEPTKTYYLRNDTSWLKTADLAKGPWAPAGTLPDELHEAAGRRELEGRQGEPCPARRSPPATVPTVFVSTTPAEMILLRGAPSYVPVDGHRPAVGQQHRQRRVPARQDRAGLLPRRRPLVLGAGLHRPVDVRDADAAGRLQEDSARARALARAGVGARHRSGDRSGAARADPADGARQQEGAEGAGGCLPGRRRSSRRSKRPPCSARSTPTRTIFKVGDVYYMCYQGVWFVGKSAGRSVGGREDDPAGDLQDPGQLALASRHLRHHRRRR